ncbi:MAG: anthranilate synthase component I family protein [Nitrospirota bacterium]|nr:MAG: anthranilate synthase component I family protein [Nitrospirota bacterium]
MRSYISKKEFLARCAGGPIPPLSVEVHYSDPAYIYSAFRNAKTILLQSGKGPEHISRFSFITFDPYMELKVKNGRVETIINGKRTISFQRPLSKLRKILGAYDQLNDPQLPPFQGGAIGLISYDFVHYFERLPVTVKDDLLIPDAHFLIVDKVVSFDQKLKKAWVVICPGARERAFTDNISDIDLSLAYDRAVEEIQDVLKRLENIVVPEMRSRSKNGKEIFYEMERPYYVDMVKRAKEYIRAGDIFQANLSQRVSADMGGTDTWDMYRKLFEINPSPFASYADLGDYVIVSSSPERLVRLRNGIADTRPIAGTRPRGRDHREDERMRRELILNKKERAEHIMLIDLERNDIGKVCDYGTVEVDELMITEDYSHVIHIVSNVKGRMAENKDCFDLVRATFPGGTITGVPKVRCMEIIDELEPVKRGPYTGSIGYIGYSGIMDMNIVIRTFVCKDERSYVHVGAGIVADSDPEKEYLETLKKAEALIKTLNEVG